MKSIQEVLKEMSERGRVVEDVLMAKNPELVALFHIYQNEAIEARKLLDENLLDLSETAEILEVGGGILALSIQLASEGFKVTSIEPIGKGFDGINSIMQIFLEIAQTEKLYFNLYENEVEDFVSEKRFDFVFSINVMEHLRNPYLVMAQITELLNQNGSYRFICPNYSFPYEPHFAKLMFLRKNQAFHLSYKRASKNNQVIGDSLGLYQSINFITYNKLQRNFDYGKFEMLGNKKALFRIASRSLSDDTLQKRHTTLHKIVKFLLKLKLLNCLKFFPISIQPILDITITNRSNSNSGSHKR
jgi:2-polyprenyl-3-methyl-5-hydroxy-6-metoxy-1,4-benzoquinol methylase